MHINILGNSEDVSMWITELARATRCKCFSHILFDFSHLFLRYFKKT